MFDLAMPVLAHIGPHAHQLGTGFSVGFTHPFSGADHLLAMIAVGLWAVQLGGKARWALPSAFIGFMLVGGLIGWSGLYVHPTIIESGILASVFAFGLLIVWAKKMPLGLGLGLTGAFAMFHGLAHAVEMPAGSQGSLYAAGFVLATATIHTTGVGLGIGLAKPKRDKWLRACGGAVTVLALLMTINVI